MRERGLGVAASTLGILSLFKCWILVASCWFSDHEFMRQPSVVANSAIRSIQTRARLAIERCLRLRDHQARRAPTCDRRHCRTLFLLPCTQLPPSKYFSELYFYRDFCQRRNPTRTLLHHIRASICATLIWPPLALRRPIGISHLSRATLPEDSLYTRLRRVLRPNLHPTPILSVVSVGYVGIFCVSNTV